MTCDWDGKRHRWETKGVSGLTAPRERNKRVTVMDVSYRERNSARCGKKTSRKMTDNLTC